MENAEEINEISVVVECSPEATRSPYQIDFGGVSRIEISKGKRVIEPNLKVITGKEITMNLVLHLLPPPGDTKSIYEPDIAPFNPTSHKFEKGKTYLVYINENNEIKISENKLATKNENA